VRSNDIGEIGFIKDERRLNVAMTRAQKKLVIIGDSATLGQFSLFRSLIEHVEKEGNYDSAWNYLEY
jgi:superfamily I DNA and/or RNA helicase